MKKGQEPMFPTILRQVGENDFRVASIKDQNEGQFLTSSFGMSTRLYLAGMAMQGLLANPDYMETYEGSKYLLTPQIITIVALGIADELIKQEEESRQ